MSNARRTLAIGVAAVLSSVAVALAAESWEREFAQGIGSNDSNLRYKVVTDLDPNIEKARDLLLGVLARETWHVREGAIDRLAEMTDATGIEELKKHLVKHSNEYVREGIALALGKKRDTINHAIPALSDKSDKVRRAIAMRAAANPTKELIVALIDRIETEKDPDIRAFVRHALEEATGQYFAYSAQDWKNWWFSNQESWKPKEPEGPPTGKPGEEGGLPLRPKTEEDKKAEEEGRKASESTTTLRDVELTFKELGRGGPLFILPELYRSGGYMEREMSTLEDVARLFYIDLPPLSKFRGLQNVGATGRPYYPLDKLADAFEELRKERKQERIAIMGHGMAAWVGIRYATKYPKQVSHLVLVSTWPSNSAWSKGLDRVLADGKQRKDAEQEHCAQNWVVDVNTGKANYEPKDPQEQEALNRMRWTLNFADPRNALAFHYYKTTHRDLGGCIIPEFDIAKEKSNPVPTLIVVGTHPRALWMSMGDVKQFQKFYPNSEVLQCPNSGQMPMIEDFETFSKGVRAFFKKYPFKKPKEAK